MPVKLDIAIEAPIELVARQSGMAVGPRGWSAYELARNNGFEGTEIQWLESLKADVSLHEQTFEHTQIATSAQVTTGVKSSATDAGTFGQISITDDYAYICVKSGEAGTAVWKKMVMFQT